ncbi:MAG: cupin domain-containing protein [Leptothrix sp. (in: b-proteobacteria)]
MPMPKMTLAEFESQARADGFEAVLARTWPPLAVLDPHTHPFDARAVVTQGEMWLTVGHTTDHLLPGDGFALARGIEHAERYGPEGATYWVARRGEVQAPDPQPM